MTSILKIRIMLLLVMYIQIGLILTSPLKIIQAKSQVMMHTLQQPPPIETLQSLKVQKLHQDLQTSAKWHQMMMANLQQQMATQTLQELAKIQAMQYATDQVEMHPPDLMQTWFPQMQIQNMHPQSVPWQLQTQEEQQQSMMPMIQQMSEDAMQEITLQQQMLALQQMQAFNQLNTAHSSYTFPQPEPVLILLPDEKIENSNKLYKHTNENDPTNNEHTKHENEDIDSVTVKTSNEQASEAPKGTRKAILLIPNARFSIGGIISQIPWLPVEVNVPDTAIWAWNGIYNGISSIISGIGNRLPWRPRPQDSAATSTEPSVKLFLKQLQRNDYNQAIPVYQMPLDAVIPVDFNY